MMGWLRRLFAEPDPEGMKPGDTFPAANGGTLTYLGKAPDKWVARRCDVCGGPATLFLTQPPWPGSTHAHTTMTCDAHASYMDGWGWSWSSSDNVYRETPIYSNGCATCREPYGTCEHTAEFARIMAWQEALEVRGRLEDWPGPPTFLTGPERPL